MSSATVRVEKATSDLLIGPDWTMNMDICDSINSNHWLAKDLVKAVKKRLQNKNPRVQLLTLTLLETMIKNCGDYVHLQVAERNILQEMIKIVRKKADMSVRDKILVLLDSWQEAFGGPRGKYPQYYWAYDELRRSGVEFPQRSPNAAPIFTPPATHPTTRHSIAGYGMPSNSTRTLDEAMASDMESLSLSSLDSFRGVMELLNEMLQAVNPSDPEALKDEVISDLVSSCRSNQKKLVALLNSTGDEELLGQGLALNDSLQALLAKHDAIASGSPLPTEAIGCSASPAPGTGSQPSKANDSSSEATAHETQVVAATQQVDEEDEEDDDFAQLARRRSRTSTATETTTTATAADSTSTPCNALALPDPPTPVRTTTREQEMIDLLSLTLYTNSTSPHSPLTPPSSHGTSTLPPSSNQAGHQVPITPDAQGPPYGPQQYPVHQGQIAFDSYVVPWAQTQPQPQPQPQLQSQPQPQPQPQPQSQLPQYSSSYPPPPWAVPSYSQYGQSSSTPYPYQTTQVNPTGSYMPLQSARPLQQFNSFSSRGNNGPSAFGEAQSSSSSLPVGSRPLQHFNSFGSRGSNTPSTFGQAQARPNPRHVSPPAGNKPFVPSYRLFEDLVDLRNADGGAKTSLSGSSTQGMVGGRK